MKDYTQGSIVKALVSLAVPVVLTNLLHSAYHLTDTFWVGRLGADAVAAVSLSFPVIFLMMTLGGGFSMAGTILVAQYKGNKNQEQVDHVSAQTIVLMFLIAIVVSVLGYYVSAPILNLMNADTQVIAQGIGYLKISFIGMTFLFSFFVFQSLMRGIGETRLPLIIVFCTVMLNLVLDPLFIMGWGPINGYGIQGAAIATILTQGLATIAGMYILIRGKNGINLVLKNFAFDKELVKKMFFLGLPSSVEQSMKSLGLMLISFLVATFSTAIVASYGIGIRVLTFVIIPAFGLSMATSTLVGQNMGANQPDRAEAIARKSSTLAVGVIVCASIIIYLLAEPITRAFIPDNEDVVQHAATFVRFLTLALPLIGLQLNLNGVYSGSGNTKTSMMFSIVALWVFEFPITYVLSKHTGLEEYGLWMASPIANLLTVTVTLSYFLMGRWKNTKIIENKSSQEKLEDAVLKESMIEEGM